MKLTKVLLLAGLVGISYSPVNAQTYHIKAPNGIKLHNGPGKGNATVADLPNNGTVTLIKKEGNWWKVKYNGKTGYVNSQSLSVDDGSSVTKPSKKSAPKPAAAPKTYSWGIGARLGDPTGITIKKYLAKGMAIEGSFGFTRFLAKNAFYNNKFNTWYLDKNYAYADFQYLGFTSTIPVGMQVHYLFQKPMLKSKVGGLNWYFGFGAQMTYRSYTFDYRYKLDGNSNWLYTTGERATEFDFGVDGVIGVEYTLPNAPVSFFIDATLYMEIINNPFLFNANYGLGARYNF